MCICIDPPSHPHLSLYLSPYISSLSYINIFPSTQIIFILSILGALQEINGLSLAQASKESFKLWFANYTAIKAGVDIPDVNVTGVFPASVFMDKDLYQSTHDPSIGYGDPGDQTVVQYSVKSTQISEPNLLLRLNTAILTNETTAGTRPASTLY